MPIPSSADHVSYAEQAKQGTLELEVKICTGSDCPAEGKEETLVLSKSTVERGLIVLVWDEHLLVFLMLKRTLKIALARCTACGARIRVLPCNAQAHKHYAIEAITLMMVSYAPGQRSLRAVVGGYHFRSDDPAKIEDRQVHHSTLHRWTEGFAIHVLDRHCSRTHGEAFSHFLAQALMLDSRVRQAMEVPVCADPQRYRSEARREHLEAMMRGLLVAAILANTDLDDPGSLRECRRLILLSSKVCLLGFPSRILCTAIRRRCGSARAGSRPNHQTPAKQARDSCKIRTRSPPGASSR